MSEENLNSPEKKYTEQEWNGLLTDKQNEVRTRQQLQSDKSVSDRTIAEQRLRIKELESFVCSLEFVSPAKILY